MTPRLRHMGFAAMAGFALVAVFALYTQPDFLRQLADQLWACF